MTDYQNGKIYKIEAHNGEEGDIYIGSTCKQHLSQRMDKHISYYKRWKEEKTKYTYTSFQLFDKYGIENCNIVLLESFPSDSKDSLLAKEAFYIKSIKCVNKFIPLRTQKEYYNDNKENKKQYVQDNKIKIISYQKQYHDQYRQDNKEKIKERKSKLFICNCGKVINYEHKARHLRTNIHNSSLATTSSFPP
jgi:hypothetical protein